jgi:hypothetical protein
MFISQNKKQLNNLIILIFCEQLTILGQVGHTIMQN